MFGSLQAGASRAQASGGLSRPFLDGVSTGAPRRTSVEVVAKGRPICSIGSRVSQQVNYICIFRFRHCFCEASFGPSLV